MEETQAIERRGQNGQDIWVAMMIHGEEGHLNIEKGSTRKKKAQSEKMEEHGDGEHNAKVPRII